MDPNTKYCSCGITSLIILSSIANGRLTFVLLSKQEASIPIRPFFPYGLLKRVATKTLVIDNQSSSHEGKKKKNIPPIPVGHLYLFTVAVHTYLNEPRLINLCA